MRKVLLAVLSCAIVLLPLVVAGQQRGLIVSGKVTDEAGNPLPGTNVIVGDYNLGAATDIKGAYRFIVPEKFLRGQEVEVTARFIGYHSKTEKIVLSPGAQTLDFVLAEDILEMEAIVVTGVAEETPKRLLPFTVDRVSKEQIEMVPQQNPILALQGKVAGVHVVQGEGTPGTTSLDVRLRGSTNIGSGNEPLYIVDGVVLMASQVDIDALDIESIEVVKGAAAAAIYGARAANGVIFVRTKRGGMLGLGQTRIWVRNEFGFNQFPGGNYRSEHHEFKLTDDGRYFVDKDGNALDSTGTYGPIWNYKNAVMDGASMKTTFQDNEWPVPTYDHVKQFFNPGQFMRNYVSISQNTPGTNFLLSFGNLMDSGVIDGVKGYRRKNVRLNLDQKVRENISLGSSLYYSSSWRDDPDGSVDPFYSIMFMSPMANLTAPNEDGEPFNIDPDPKSLEENPLYASHFQDLDFYRKRLTGSFNLTYTPVTWFNLEGRFSYDRSDRLRTDYYPHGFKSIDMQNNPTGFYRRRHRFDEGLNSMLTASLYKSFGDLSTKTKFRYYYEQDKYESTNAEGENLAVNGVKDLGNVQEAIGVDSWQQLIRGVGYYGGVDLNYKEKYLGSVLLRHDGSSLFGPEERWHTYYRGSLAWRLTREPFWFTDKINEFKLRASYGTAGSRPAFWQQYETFSVSGGIISKERLGNKELKPAFSKELEVGLEMAFLDRFFLELVYARKNTEDQILEAPLAKYYGYTEQILNAGDLEANTIEGNLNAFIIRKKDMSWSAGLIFDRVREKITRLDRPAWRTGPYAAFYMREGETHGSMYGYKWMTSKGELDKYYVDDTVGGWAQYRDQFDVNDDGYLVPVGEGNTWKSGPGADGELGTADDLWGTKVDVDGDGTGDLDWGIPFRYTELKDGEANQFVKIGDVIPDFSLGFNTTFKWKGLTLYALFDAEIGGDIYNETRQWCYRELRHYNVDQYGKPENEKKPLYYYSQLYDTNRNNSEFAEDGTYLKLREISLQYRFDRLALSKFAGGLLSNIFHGVTVGVIGRNLLTFTNYSGFDPEVGSVEYRVDGFEYPHFRQFTGIVEFEF